MEQLRGPVDRLGYGLYHAASEVLQADPNHEGKHRSFGIGVFSASAAAALIYIGSGGVTKAKLLQVLHLENIFESRVSPELVMIAFRQAITNLTKRIDHHFPIDEATLYSGFQVYLANKVFLRVGTECSGEFRDNAKLNFDMDMDEIGHKSLDVEETRKQINEWVRVNTNNRIQEMLPPLTLEESLSSCANMFLINASCMRGKWEKPFRTGRLRDFECSDGRKTHVEMMRIRDNFPYLEDTIDGLEVQYLEIPFFNREASMCLVLPKSSKKKGNLLELEKKLEYDTIIKLATQKRLRTVSVILPKFNVENTFDLKDLFIRVGMKSAFEKDADFTDMVEDEKFHLAGAFHKSAIEIDEDGAFSEPMPEVKTSEASSTSLRVPGQDDMDRDGSRSRSSSVGSSTTEDHHWSEDNIKPTVADVAQFTADRPFLFAIRHNLSGLILFVGRVCSIPTSPKSEQYGKIPRSTSFSQLLSPRFLQQITDGFLHRTRHDSSN